MTRPILLLALAVLCVAGCVYADEPFNFYPEDSTYTTDSVFYRNNYTIIVVPTADIEAGIVPCECMRVGASARRRGDRVSQLRRRRRRRDKAEGEVKRNRKKRHTRRHHNTSGLRQVRRGQTRKQVARIAKRLGIPLT